jgi:AF4/FMR2 family protein 3
LLFICSISVVVCCDVLQVLPSAADKVTRQIQSKLGDYEAVQQILEDDSKRLIGIDGVPPSPAPGGTHTFFSAAARLQQNSEFKKPSSHQHGSVVNNGRANNHYHPHSAPRGGFVKPADGKPPHGGRGGYPGQPVKHGGGSNDHRSNGGIVPPKGPPQGGGGSNSRVQQVARTLPRLNVNQVSTCML